jgi:hypothetical protein
VKEEEKNRSVEKQIQNGREEKKKNPRNGLDRNGLKSTACVFFLVCRSPSVQKGRGEEAVTDSPVFAAARGSTRRQWRWRVEESRRHCSIITEDAQNAPALFPKLFVIFQCCCVHLDY